jgi:hypothetical protein
VPYALLGGQQLDDVRGPRLGRFLVETVDVDPVHHPVRTQLRQSRIEQLAGVAEQFVGASPSASTAKFRCSSRAVSPLKRLPELGGRIGKSALAEGGDHHDEMGGVLHLARFDLIQLDGLDLERSQRPTRRRSWRRPRISHIGAECDDERQIGLPATVPPWSRVATAARR